MRAATWWLALALALAFMPVPAFAQEAPPRVIDIPTREGVTQRFLYLAPPAPKAIAVLYAGGHGGLQIASNGSFGWGRNNFLVRARQYFVENDVAVAIVDAPGDRLSPPYLTGFRETPEHAADARAVIAWLRAQSSHSTQYAVPVWLIGTSRGTQSVASIAIALGSGDGGPDGIVLTSTILRDGRAGHAADKAVPDLDLAAIKIPVLVVHHQDDACPLCPVADTNALMTKFTNSPRAKLMIVSGGNTQGDACEAFAYHGYNGIENEVVRAITTWMHAPSS